MYASIALLLIVVCFRVLMGMSGTTDATWLHNFSPLSAVALCGAFYLPRRLAWALPLGMLLLSDIILNLSVYHVSVWDVQALPSYVALIAITALGFALRGRVGVAGLLGGSVAGSTLFYLLSNTGAWLGQPLYPRTLAGWIQALTVGLPGYPSTLFFYRNTFVSDLLFTGLFAGCMALCPRSQAAVPAPQAEPVS